MNTARNKALYIALSVCGNIGYQVGSVAIGWHVFTLRHHALDLGLVGLALFLPAFVFALPAGAYADRHDRRHIVALCGIAEAVATCALVGLVLAHVMAVPWYLVILFCVGVARAFEAPAARSILPALVPPDEYVRTQAAFSSIREFVRVGGPALGGILVAYSTAWALAISAGLTFAAAVLFRALVMAPVAKPTARGTWRDAIAGLQFIRSQPIVAGAISLDLFAVLFGGATALLPAFADGIFHAGATGLGYMRAAPAIGATLVALAIARRPIERNVGPILLTTVAGFGIATIVFGISRNFALSLVALAFVGGTDMVSVVIRSALVQLATPDTMRGRVNAVEAVFIGASNELGEFESGTLAAFAGVVPSVIVGGIATILVVIGCAAIFPTLRNVDRFAREPT